MPGALLQPVGQAGLLLSAASASSPLGCWVKLRVLKHPVPKCPVREKQALGQLPPPASLPAWLCIGLGCPKFWPMGPSTNE